MAWRVGGICSEMRRIAPLLLNAVPTQIRMVAGVGFEPTTFGLRVTENSVCCLITCTYGDSEVWKSTPWTPYSESIGSAFLKLGFAYNGRWI